MATRRLVRLLGNLRCDPSGLVPCFGLLRHSGAALSEAAFANNLRYMIISQPPAQPGVLTSDNTFLCVFAVVYILLPFF